MDLSHFQQAILAHVAAQVRSRHTGRQHRNLVVQATAGSGKSTTLRLICEAVAPLGARCDLVAFNARVAADAQGRLPSNARALTLHAAGKRAWESLCGRRFTEAAKMDASRLDGELDGRKTDRIVAKLKQTGAIDRYVSCAHVKKLVSRAKSVGLVPLTSRIADTEAGVEAHQRCDFAASAALVGRRGLARCGTSSPIDLEPQTQDTEAAWRELVAVCEIQTSAPGLLVAAARVVLVRSVESAQLIIDFDDMVYLPALVGAARFEHRDLVLVDELQDLDRMQRAMVRKMCAGDAASGVLPAIFVGVGDRMQAIYSFRGADSGSMDAFVRELECVELPLSICYRCPTSGVEYARQWCGDIQAAPGAVEGEVVDYSQGVYYEPNDGLRLPYPDEAIGGPGSLEVRNFPRSSDFRPGDAVVCRLNAPLVGLAYVLLRARVPFRLLGRNFGRGVAALVEATKCATAEAALCALRGRLQRLDADDAKKRLAGQLDDGPSDQTAALRERVEVLQEVYAMLDVASVDHAPLDPDDAGGYIAGASAAAEASVSAHDLLAEVERLFSESGDGDSCVTLGSIHRQKGAEYDRVFWLDPDNCQARPGASEVRESEIRNLCFIAATRHRQSLFLIHSRHIP